ncbi:hypothetical protein FR483_n678R [Paramecium bursaria Chlorella virus FR483]|uniref:Uncharacterized protein n678R n=1 Tax=Paramecium bursaria Chlorella virus FR483 TaxID=399781 RepID=A7J832_PBCVF|nr:hypothetical protein FR483_n678R [Paramecium bursaria Chlorella virus FR483]ABT15963.1 hypothetical protein FR483_n678R [Paramecium bursaria Chlorella virus FR483]
MFKYKNARHTHRNTYYIDGGTDDSLGGKIFVCKTHLFVMQYKGCKNSHSITRKGTDGKGNLISQKGDRKDTRTSKNKKQRTRPGAVCGPHRAHCRKYECCGRCQCDGKQNR